MTYRSWRQYRSGGVMCVVHWDGAVFTLERPGRATITANTVDDVARACPPDGYSTNTVRNGMLDMMLTLDLPRSFERAPGT